MTERPSLFRQEALEFRAGRERPDGVLRIDPPWTRWLYWIVLATVAAGVVVAMTTRTSETTSGPARLNVQERTFVALVPDAASSDLQRGQAVRIRMEGPASRFLDARVLRTEIAGRAAVRRAGFPSFAQPAVLVRGVLSPDGEVPLLPSPLGQQGRAVVVLGSETILDLFLRQLSGMFGSGGDS